MHLGKVVELEESEGMLEESKAKSMARYSSVAGEESALKKLSTALFVILAKSSDLL